MKTPFEQFIEDVESGKQKTPKVSMNQGEIPYIKYQLAVHKYEFKLYSNGIIPNRQFKISEYKKYYGLVGRDRVKLLNQFMEIFNKYMKPVTS
jgi:hypothetical protein